MPSSVEHISPKDRFVTVYGRKPVLEAHRLMVDKVILSYTAHGSVASEILRAATAPSVPVHRANAHRVHNAGLGFT